MHFKNFTVILLLLFATLAESNDAFQPQLAAPSDGVQFYQKLQQAQQLYEKQIFLEWHDLGAICKSIAQPG
jgi:hypothetical protein